MKQIFTKIYSTLLVPKCQLNKGNCAECFDDICMNKVFL